MTRGDVNFRYFPEIPFVCKTRIFFLYSTDFKNSGRTGHGVNTLSSSFLISRQENHKFDASLVILEKFFLKHHYHHHQKTVNRSS